MIDLIAMIFGMPAALFPVLAVTQFHRGPAVAGLLFAAPSVGALVGALSGGWVRHVRRQGDAVIWAVVAWGAAIAAFGFAGSHLWWALGFLAIAGAADVISAIFRSTITQVNTPDRLRGRLSAIFILVVTGGPRPRRLRGGPGRDVVHAVHLGDLGGPRVHRGRRIGGDRLPGAPNVSPGRRPGAGSRVGRGLSTLRA